ncbi:hypothetical protein DMH27_04800 [Raoultella planticola]|nr:hypothetical protein [Raoultella planticola]
MNYLARALPVDSVAGRFALTDEEGSWDLLGITPVRFEKHSGMEPFKELFEGCIDSLSETSVERSTGSRVWLN